MKRISPRGHSFGFTFIALLIIIAVLAILAAMLLPALAKAKQRAQRIACANNLKQDALAFKIWAMDNDDRFPMSSATNRDAALWLNNGEMFRFFLVMSNELNTPKILACPSDNRPPASSFRSLQNANVSYFIGLDATDLKPSMLLAGDRNIDNGLSPVGSVLVLPPDHPTTWTPTMHNRQGNIGLSDGSVQMTTSAALQNALHHTGDTTNRIALPDQAAPPPASRLQ